MAIKLTVYSNAIPILDEIYKAHTGVAKESLSVAGNHLRTQARISLVNSEKTGWSFKNAGRGRVLTYNSRYGRRAGQRLNRKTGTIDNPSNMANFITSVMYEESLQVVVGGKNKTKRVKKYRDGVPTGTIKVPGVSKDTFKILEKLNNGGTYSLNKKQQNKLKMTDIMVLKKGKLVPMKLFAGMDFSTVTYKKRNFMSKGYFRARPMIEYSLTKRYEALLKKKVDNLTVKEKKVV